MKVTLTSTSLLQGAWYAVEQAGRLLTSSVTLFEAGDHSTAVALAMFGREELGRSRILRRLADTVANGATVTPDHVRDACDDHAEKQKAGISSVAMRPDRETGLGKLITKTMENPPASKAWQDAEKQLETITETVVKRMPDDRHQLRMRTIYVDVKESGSWQRPCTMSREEAHHKITDAVNDYACERDRLSVTQDFPAMADALENMGDPKFSLPPPRWPR